MKKSTSEVLSQRAGGGGSPAQEPWERTLRSTKLNLFRAVGKAVCGTLSRTGLLGLRKVTVRRTVS